MTLYPYGAAWKAHRKAMTQALSVTASMDYRGMQYEETVKFLHKLTSAPNNFSTLIEQSVYPLDDHLALKWLTFDWQSYRSNDHATHVRIRIETQ